MDEADSGFRFNFQADDVEEKFNLVIAELPKVQRGLYFSAVENGATRADALTAIMRLFTPERPGERED